VSKKPIEAPQCIKAFHENEITAEAARSLTDSDLKALGVAALGHRKRILSAFGGRSNAATAGTPEQPAQSPRIGGSKAVADALWQANWLAWWMVIIAAGVTVPSAVVSAYSLASGSGGGGVACPSILALLVIVGLWRRSRILCGSSVRVLGPNWPAAAAQLHQEVSMCLKLRR